MYLNGYLYVTADNAINFWAFTWWRMDSKLILGLRPANERQCYFVTTSLIGWAQA